MVMSETLVDLIVGGWRAYAAITEAMRKSRSQPGVDQIVALRSHTITAQRHHDLDIEVDSVAVMTLSTQLVVRLQLYDALAIVRDEQLVAVRSGQAKADGTVTVEGVEVAQRTLTFPLTAELALHSPRGAPVGSYGGVTSSPPPPPSVPAGWYPDPRGARLQRYWNGTAWTEHTAPLTLQPVPVPRRCAQIAGIIRTRRPSRTTGHCSVRTHARTVSTPTPRRCAAWPTVSSSGVSGMVAPGGRSYAASCTNLARRCVCAVQTVP
jgi:hypothetical protein